MPGRGRYRQGKCGSDEHSNPCSRLFKVLASDQRLEILRLLQEGEKSSAEITEQLHLDASVISRHLRMMRNFRMIAVRKERNVLFFSIADKRVLEMWSIAREIITDLYTWNLGKID
ncbi:MAG: winged helix-turn-helix transcriptional regulator [Bacteroidales bacterium]|nr:winged helix-turn-helix transcriptional regulator [Bacteroidales bacterium]